MSAELAGAEPGVARARQALALARWAARAYAGYDVAKVRSIAAAVARVAEANASRYAREALQESGFGLVEDTAGLNRLGSAGVLAAYGERDFVSARIDLDRGTVEVPSPVGVVLCLTGRQDAVRDVYTAVLLVLLTRNAVVFCPDPQAGEGGLDAARRLAAAAVAAGAPAGVIQVVEASAAVRAALIGDERVDLVVQAEAPVNVPVLVDASADLDCVAAQVLTSKAFGHSLSNTAESVLLVEESVADPLLAAMQRAGGYLLDIAERDRVRAVLFPDGSPGGGSDLLPGGKFDPELAGRDVATIAARAGVVIPADTRVLLAQFDQVLIEEPLAHVKPCPVLGVVRVPDVPKGIRTAAVLLRLDGSDRLRGSDRLNAAGGGSAVIHSQNPATVLAFAAAARVARVVVNAGGSPGPAGLEPDRLLTWTRVDYPQHLLPDVLDLQSVFADSVPSFPVPSYLVPSYPVASNLVDQ